MNEGEKKKKKIDTGAKGESPGDLDLVLLF